MRTLTFNLAISALTLALTVGAAQGEFIVNAVKTGGDVVFTGEGSLNLEAWTLQDESSPDFAFIQPVQFLVIGPSDSVLSTKFNFPIGFVGPIAFGILPLTSFPDSGTGDIVGLFFNQPALAVPVDYVSGESLSSSTTYDGKTFLTLGMIPDTYVWSWGSGDSADSFTLNVVPEPSTAVLMSLGLVGLASRRRRP
jgi:hypothetical protein